MNIFGELAARLEKTSRARFHASRRMTLHSKWSVWTISIVSIVLIVFGVYTPTGLDSHLKLLAAAGQIGSAITILAYSIYSSAEHYDLKSHLFHQCGIKLNALKKRLRPYEDLDESKIDLNEYKSFLNEEAAILSEYENHEPNDYNRALSDLNFSYHAKIYWKILYKIRFFIYFWLYVVIITFHIWGMIYILEKY